jgi:DNA-binding MarR family transcriptional regulator
MTAAAQTTDDLDVVRIEVALGVIIRHASLPSTFAALADRAGVHLPPGVDRSAYSLLARIDRLGPIRPSAIAQQSGVKLSTISRQLAELERHHMVERAVDPDDGRASTFTIGGPGRELLHGLRAVRHEGLGARLEGWSDRDRERFAVLLTRFAASMDPELFAMVPPARG